MIRQSTAKASLPVEILASRYFIDWLQSQQISLAFSTYQSSRLMLLGVYLCPTPHDFIRVSCGC
ncbi:hypothetical protein [Nostoc sp.]|uniref:hypothetical protein n=1 Tax=Nostoc sp. TaxID=1180 RepID=UPI002FFAE2C2